MKTSDVLAAAKKVPKGDGKGAIKCPRCPNTLHWWRKGTRLKLRCDMETCLWDDVIETSVVSMRGGDE